MGQHREAKALPIHTQRGIIMAQWRSNTMISGKKTKERFNKKFFEGENWNEFGTD